MGTATATTYDVRVHVEGPGVERWAETHASNATGGRFGNLWLAEMNPARFGGGQLTFMLIADDGGMATFANTVEALQIAVEKVATLPGADLLAAASINIAASLRWLG